MSLTFNKTAEKTENHQTVENTDVMDLVELRTDEQRAEETFFFSCPTQRHVCWARVLVIL